MKQPAVYIMASSRNGTLYTGVTSNLSLRAYQHREGLTPGFTTRYGCKLLVWYEYYERMDEAIAREKQLKGGSRRQKLALIEAMNPTWRDSTKISRGKVPRRHCERSEAIQSRGAIAGAFSLLQCGRVAKGRA
jgi:putative endonuclease